MHRRRIYTEGKAKVIAAIWVTEFIQFLVALAIFHQDGLKNRMNSSFSTEFIQFLVTLAIFHQDDLKNRMNSSFSSYHPGAKLVARQGIE